MGRLADIMGRLRGRSAVIEGQPRDGPWYVSSEPSGWLPAAWGKFWNYWQMDYDPLGGYPVTAVVEACVAAYAQTIAQCPGDHWRATYGKDGKPDGGRERVTNSGLSRILRRPNDYQSRSDFILNLVRHLYLDGNTYALAQRNDRFEVTALHPFDPLQSKPLIGPNSEIFYELAGNNVLDPQAATGTPFYPFSSFTNGTSRRIAPARDVLHVKLEAKRNEPLVGIPPAKHAAQAVAAQTAIGSQLIQGFANMNRPAGVIETEQNLTAQQVKELRQRFNEAWRGIDNLDGGPPILTNGFKFHGISMTAKDAELAALARLSWDEIFMVYGVPPAILGMTDRSSFGSTESLMRFWLARGLGFAINHIETAFDHFFGLKGYPDEYVEFDTSALLRAETKDRIEALARGVQGGIYAPNEARRQEELPATPYGDEPRVQQQVVPLSAWAQTAEPATPAPEAAPAAPTVPVEETETDEGRAISELEPETLLEAGIKSYDDAATTVH